MIKRRKMRLHGEWQLDGRNQVYELKYEALVFVWFWFAFCITARIYARILIGFPSSHCIISITNLGPENFEYYIKKANC